MTVEGLILDSNLQLFDNGYGRGKKGDGVLGQGWKHTNVQKRNKCWLENKRDFNSTTRVLMST